MLPMVAYVFWYCLCMRRKSVDTNFISVGTDAARTENLVDQFNQFHTSQVWIWISYIMYIKYVVPRPYII